MSILVLICSIFCITKATLTCNGVEYTVSTVTTTTPTDVCYTSQSTISLAFSYWYECINNEVYVQQYSHPDCLGDAVTFKFTDMYASTATSLQEACNLGACKYANVRQISAVWRDCSNTTTLPNNLETYMEKVFIQDKCYNNMDLNSEIWTCSSDNLQATYSYFSSTNDCSGEATQSITINTNEIACDNTNNGIGGSSGIPIYVSCGSASFAGNDNTLAPVPSTTPIPINQCTNTALDCKAVEWSISGITTAYPLDVCFSVETTANGITNAASYWYKCQNGVPYISTYQTADCQGNGIDIALLSMYPLSEYVTVCCDLAACEYVLQKTYSSVDLDCSDSDPFPAELEAYTSLPIVSGYCNAVSDLASWKWSCSGNEATQDYFVGNGECNGNATVTLYDITLDVSCDETDNEVGASIAIGLQCGTASFNGGSNINTGGTSSTTSTSTTPCPSIGCIGDQSKANNKYYVNVFGFIYSQIVMFFFVNN